MSVFGPTKRTVGSRPAAVLQPSADLQVVHPKTTSADLIESLVKNTNKKYAASFDRFVEACIHELVLKFEDFESVPKLPPDAVPIIRALRGFHGF